MTKATAAAPAVLWVLPGQEGAVAQHTACDRLSACGKYTARSKHMMWSLPHILCCLTVTLKTRTAKG